MAVTSEPFQPSVHYTNGHRAGAITGMGYALERAWWNDDDRTFREIMNEGLRRYGDDFREEAKKRGIKL